MNIAGIKNFDVGNGEGVRVSVFVSGCRIHCKGCHNSEAWDFNYGEKLTDELKSNIFEKCKNENISGLSILGGEPFDKDNREEVLQFIKDFKEQVGKNIWIWTGYTIDELKKEKSPTSIEIIKLVDVIVEGPFIEEKKDITLRFRGSSNQRILVKDGNKFKVMKE